MTERDNFEYSNYKEKCQKHFFTIDSKQLQSIFWFLVVNNYIQNLFQVEIANKIGIVFNSKSQQAAAQNMAEENLQSSS